MRKQQEQEKQTPPQLLDFWRLCDFVGLPKVQSTRIFAWRGARDGTFPAPIKLSAARIAWRRDEVEKWLAERPRPAYAKVPGDVA